MDLRLKKESLELMHCVLERTTEDAFTADAVVPDTLPDVTDICVSDGDFCLWRLDLSAGCAEAEGEWKGSVCYRSENDDGLYSFPLSVGVRLRMHDDAIKPEMRPFAVFRVTDAQAQIMNSRKIRMNVRVLLSMQGFTPSVLELTSDVENAEAGVFVKRDSCRCSMITQVEEQVFTVGGESTMRQQPRTGKLLSARSELIWDPPQISASRAVLRGVVRSHILYLGDQENTYIAEMVQMPFSQLLDLDGLTDTDVLRSRLQLTSAELSIRGEKTVSAEFHVVAQTCCIREADRMLLSDAYSVTASLELEQETVPLQQIFTPEPVRVTAQATIPDQPGPGNVLDTAAQLKSLSTDGTMVRGEIVCRALIERDGAVSPASGSILFSSELQPNQRLDTARIASVDASLNGTELNLRAAVVLALQEIRPEQKQVIVSISQTEETSSRETTSSVILLPKTGQEDLWDIAKRYGSSTAAIQAANQIQDDRPEPNYWLIPCVQV